MHDSHLPLRKWFLAIYLMCESRKGIAANQLKRTLGISYKTAWYLCHRIREAMGNDPLSGPALFGVVEVDESLVGGKSKGRGRAYKGNKTWVAGAIQRGGKIRVERIPNVKRHTLHNFIRRTVKDEAEAVFRSSANHFSVYWPSSISGRSFILPLYHREDIWSGMALGKTGLAASTQKEY